MINKAGSVWNINLIDLYQPFDKSFMVNLGCNNSTWGGADGMVFALQPLNTSIGSLGGQMGMGGVSPSLGVYIDTYQNTSHGDLYNDHISINLNGDVIHGSSNNIAGPYDLGEVENCNPEPLRITWDPITTFMQVFYNNILVRNFCNHFKKLCKISCWYTCIFYFSFFINIPSSSVTKISSFNKYSKIFIKSS